MGLCGENGRRAVSVIPPGAGVSCLSLGGCPTARGLERHLNTNTRRSTLRWRDLLQVVLLPGTRAGLRDPLGEVNCFKHGPMWTSTKEPGRNHRLLLCCGGSQQGWEWSAGPAAAPIASAGLLPICFGACFIPGDSKGSRFPG